MIRKLVIALTCGLLLFLWWQYPMARMRGAHLDIRHKAADDYLELHGGSQQGGETADAEGDGNDRIELVWVGDPLHPDRAEADAQSLCLKLRAELEQALGEGTIVTYSCDVGESQISAGDSRRVPLSLLAGVAGKSDGEKLVLAAAEHPFILVNDITVSENTDAPEQPGEAVVVDDNGMLVHRESIFLDLYYYLLAEPLLEQLQEAEAKEEGEALERLTGAMDARLIARAEAAQEAAEKKKACHASGRNWFDGGTTVAASTASNWSDRDNDPLPRKPSRTAGAVDNTAGCVNRSGS